MKQLIIEHPVVLLNEQMALAYTQLINLTVNCKTIEELKANMECMLVVTNAYSYFDWGFEANYFWLKQRVDYQSKELFENRILIVQT